MITIHDDKLFAELKKKAAQPANLEVSESTDGQFFNVKSGNNTYTVEVEYPEHLNENVRTFKCSCCKGDGLCEHARAVIEYLEGLDEADEVVRTMRMQTEKYLAKICRKGE
jgi:hypothetical protein